LIVYRNCDRRFPFLWENAEQPAARWHAAGEGPVQYLADTPLGAWAEFLRHEGITDQADLAGVRRALWAVEITDGSFAASAPNLPAAVLLGGLPTYEACRIEARRLRRAGVAAIKAPSAALLESGATGWRVEGGERDAEARDGYVYVVFGSCPTCVGWPVVDAGTAPARLLTRVRAL
jgi:hypothetical protein